MTIIVHGLRGLNVTKDVNKDENASVYNHLYVAILSLKTSRIVFENQEHVTLYHIK